MFSDTPQPGHYKTRLVKDGPWVPARIWINETERDEAGDYLEDQGLMMLIDGERANPEENWLWCMDNPISEAEYNFMLADSEHAKQYRPEDIKANPHQAIDLANSKPIF